MKNIFLISILLFSCKIPEKYNVVGVIKDIDIDNNRLLIDHDEIPGFMVKMVMYFNLDEKNDINQFTINDSVSFDLIIKNNDSYTMNYNLLGKSKITEDDEFWDNDNEYEKKSIGEQFNDATFLSLENKKVNLSDFKNDLIVITYIFSKCPMPNMCPASIIKNQYLSNHFKDDNITFLIISFEMEEHRMNTMN